MRTEVLQVRGEDPRLEAPAMALRRGELVVFPTETVYGLGVHALMPDAVPQVYQVKGRPSDNPLIVHIANWDQLESLTPPLEPRTRFLMEWFWPGPITFVLPKLDTVPRVVSGGLNTVGIRMPSHPVAQALIRRAGVPVAAPSANRSGRPSPTSLRDCLEDLEGRVPFILDGGACSVGVESTVISLVGARPRILRPGQVGVQELEEALRMFVTQRGREGEQEPFVLSRGHSPLGLSKDREANENKSADSNPSKNSNRRSVSNPGSVTVNATAEIPCVEETFRRVLQPGEAPEAPGMKYRHYAPRAEVRLVECGADPSEPAIWESAAQAVGGVEGFGYVGCMEGEACLLGCGLRPEWSRVYGPFDATEQATKQLFASLRELDRLGCPVILTHTLPETYALAVAYNNRLTKAAGGGSLPEEV